MRSAKAIHVVSCHAEGEVGDVIVGGVAPPPGATLWEQRRLIAEDDRLRRFMLNEPRGGVFRHVNLLVLPKDPAAAMGFIVMEPEDTPPMSGSNAMCVATVLLETGVLTATGPKTKFRLEAPGGLVEVRADCSDGRVTRVALENLPSFVWRRDQRLDVAGVPPLTVDLAFGGDSLVLLDPAQIGLASTPENARRLAEAGAKIARAATATFGFEHPTRPDWRHVSFTLFHEPLRRDGDALSTRTTVAIRPGKLDRSPCGTGVSALMALAHDRGEMAVGDRLIARSLIGGRFDGEILGETEVGGRRAIRPGVAGRAWITGLHQHLLDPADPWPEGYRLSDTWPANF